MRTLTLMLTRLFPGFWSSSLIRSIDQANDYQKVLGQEVTSAVIRSPAQWRGWMQCISTEVSCKHVSSSNNNQFSSTERSKHVTDSNSCNNLDIDSLGWV